MYRSFLAFHRGNFDPLLVSITTQAPSISATKSAWKPTIPSTTTLFSSGHYSTSPISVIPSNPKVHLIYENFQATFPAILLLVPFGSPWLLKRQRRTDSGEYQGYRKMGDNSFGYQTRSQGPPPAYSAVDQSPKAYPQHKDLGRPGTYYVFSACTF